MIVFVQSRDATEVNHGACIARCEAYGVEPSENLHRTSNPALPRSTLTHSAGASGFLTLVNRNCVSFSISRRNFLIELRPHLVGLKLAADSDSPARWAKNE